MTLQNPHPRQTTVAASMTVKSFSNKIFLAMLSRKEKIFFVLLRMFSVSVPYCLCKQHFIEVCTNVNQQKKNKYQSLI